MIDYVVNYLVISIINLVCCFPFRSVNPNIQGPLLVSCSLIFLILSKISTCIFWWLFPQILISLVLMVGVDPSRTDWNLLFGFGLLISNFYEFWRCLYGWRYCWLMGCYNRTLNVLIIMVMCSGVLLVDLELLLLLL